MMVSSMSKRHLKVAMYAFAVVILLYIPLNVAYVFFAPILQQGVGDPGGMQGQRRIGASLHLSLDRQLQDSLLRLRDIQIQNDGSVDLKINMDMAGMVRLLGAYSDGSFDGEMTSNPLPLKVGFIIDSAHVCQNVPDLQILIYVHTAAKNVVRREILRTTWARKGLFKEDKTRLVFLMGRANNDEEQKIIHKENEKYKDLVVGDFNDNYKNLTLKAIMGLRWTSEFCKTARYVIKADDDAFVNIFALQRILKKHESKKRLMMCPLWKENTMPILRDPAKCMKWCVKFNEFPGKTHFPKYCAGLAFIMSREIVPQLYQKSLKTPFFWIDDVYISGVVAPKVHGIEYVDLLKNFTLKEKLASEEYFDEKKKDVSYYFAHVKTPATFHKMWNATLHRLGQEDLGDLSNEVINEHPALRKRLRR